jgi:Ser/Thr protein kinase RdoA (MazF antagonist)
MVSLLVCGSLMQPRTIMDEETLLRSLQDWEIGSVLEVAPLPGGSNSQTWKIATSLGKFVAKFAFDTPAFEGGLAVAEQLEFAGFTAGRPLRRRDGSLVLRSSQGALGLLDFVPGTPLDLSQSSGMWIWGATMARLHTKLLRLPRAPAGVRRWPWPWLDYNAEHVRSRLWLRNALIAAASQARDLTEARDLTLGIIHGDGAPVIADSSTGRVSVVDWGAAMWGPLLYDVASAYWFSVVEPNLEPFVFEPFAKAYRDALPLNAAEWHSLPVFVRLRGAVQGFYFAWRCDNNIEIGLSYAEENAQKLEDVRRKIELT